MVKGLFDNIDEIIPIENIPYLTYTTIIPFKDKIITDGIFLDSGKRFGNDFYKMVEKEYSKALKYYHL